MRQKVLAKKMEKVRIQLAAENLKEQEEAVLAKAQLKECEDQLGKLRRNRGTPQEIEKAEAKVNQAKEAYEKEQAEADAAREKLKNAEGGKSEAGRRDSMISNASLASQKSDPSDSVASPSNSHVTSIGDSTAQTEASEITSEPATAESDECITTPETSPMNSR